MLGNRTSEEWVAQYATSHQHPVNRFCHTVGIPMIALSFPVAALARMLPANVLVLIATVATAVKSAE